MLPDTGLKIDLLNSWPPASGAKPEAAVEVGAMLVGVVELIERVLEGERGVAVGVKGVVVMLMVVHIDAGGVENSSHWPWISAP